MFPELENTCAPNTSNWATFASGARAGTKMVAGSPTAAANPASDEAAFPVEAQVMRAAFFSIAFTTPNALARSLNDAVGLRPSSFTQHRATPNSKPAVLHRRVASIQPARCGRAVASSTGSRADSARWSDRYSQQALRQSFLFLRLRSRRAHRECRRHTRRPGSSSRPPLR